MKLQTELKLWLPVELTEKQKAGLGERMSSVELKINRKESEKKALAAQYAEEIKELESELYGLAKAFEENSEQVEVDCKVEFNSPEKGKKTIIRLDLNTVARIEDMSEYEVKAIEQPELFDQVETNEAPEMPDTEYYTKMYGFNPLDFITPDDSPDTDPEYFIADTMEKAKEQLDEPTLSDEQFDSIKNSLCVLMNEDEFKNLKESGKGKFIGMFNCNEEYSWFVFEPIIEQAINIEAVDSNDQNENEGYPVVQFNPETMDKKEIDDSYSCDTLTKDKIRGFFQIDGKDYVNAGGCADWCHAYQLVAADEYEGETHTYEAKPKNRNGKFHFYEGQLVVYRKKKFVLTNPIKIIFENTSDFEPQPDDDFESQYEIPENVEDGAN